MFGNHGLCGLPEEGAHEKSPKCLGGNLGDFGEFCKGLNLVYARKGCLPQGVKSPQPKADRKGQSQTVQTLRAQHPLKYLLHIAHLPKSSFYYHHQDRPNPDEALSPKSMNSIKGTTDKGALPQYWVGTEKSDTIDEVDR